MTFKKVKDTRHKEQVAEKVKGKGQRDQGTRINAQDSVHACLNIPFVSSCYLPCGYEESLSDEKDRKSHR